MTADGDAFDNQGNCVSYVAADDGVPVSTIALSFQEKSPSGACTWLGQITDLAPGAYRVDFYTQLGDATEPSWARLPVTIGDDGVLNVSIGSTGAGQVKLYRLPDSGVETLVAASPIVTCS